MFLAVRRFPTPITSVRVPYNRTLKKKKKKRKKEKTNIVSASCHAFFFQLEGKLSRVNVRELGGKKKWTTPFRSFSDRSTIVSRPSSKSRARFRSRFSPVIISTWWTRTRRGWTLVSRFFFRRKGRRRLTLCTYMHSTCGDRSKNDSSSSRNSGEKGFPRRRGTARVSLFSLRLVGKSFSHFRSCQSWRAREATHAETTHGRSERRQIRCILAYFRTRSTVRDNEGYSRYAKMNQKKKYCVEEGGKEKIHKRERLSRHAARQAHAYYYVYFEIACFKCHPECSVFPSRRLLLFLFSCFFFTFFLPLPRLPAALF